MVRKQMSQDGVASLMHSKKWQKMRSDGLYTTVELG